MASGISPEIESLLDEMLDAWEEARERGDTLDVLTLCRGCPELVGELTRRIDALRAWEQLAPIERATSKDDAVEPALSHAPESAVFSLSLVDLRFHSHGGLGLIYRARDRDLPRDVAIKFLREDRGEDPDRLRRFRREVEITSALDNPGIVPIYGLGRDSEDRMCYAMRFIEGTNFEDAIKAFHLDRRASRKRPSFWRNREFRGLLLRFQSACNTVAYAHSRGILHRDLKPSNIMLGPFGQTLVVDWGLARSIGRGGMSDDAADGAPVPVDAPSPDEPPTRGTVGTAGFMSPEQQAGLRDLVGPPSDVYSLGAILYVILTGRSAFHGFTPGEICSRIERGDFPSPRKVDRAIPRGLEAVCLRAMATRPEDRYGSPLDLTADVQHWLDDEPVAARPDPMPTRARRWISKNRTLSASLLGAAVVAIGAWIFVAHRENVAAIRGREQALRHAQKFNGLAYVNAEKTARERVLDRRPGWASRGLEAIRQAMKINSPLRSPPTLRQLAVECLGGIDLEMQRRLTTINSACIAFSPDGRRLAVGEHHGKPDCRVAVFDVASKKLIADYQISGRGKDVKRTGVSAVCFSRDGRWLVAGLRDGDLLVWDTEQDRPTPIALKQHTAKILKIAFAPGGDELLVGSFDGWVSRWRATGDWKKISAAKVDVQLDDLAMSPDGTFLACQVGWECKVLEVGSLMRTPPSPRVVLQHAHVRHPLAYSPDGRYLVTSDELKEDRMQLWDDRGIKTDRTLVDPDLGRTHMEEVHHVEFNPDGTLLVSGSADNTVKIWDLASNRLVLTLPVFTEALVYPTFSPDGRVLAVGSSEGTTLYDVLGTETLTTQGNLPEVVADFSFQSDGQGAAPTVATISKLYGPVHQPAHHVLSFQDLNTGRTKELVDVQEPQRGSMPAFGIASHPALPIIAFNLLKRVRLFNQGVELARFDTAENPSSLDFSRDGARLWGVIDELRVVSRSTNDLSIKTSWQDTRRAAPSGRVGIACLDAGSSWVVVGSRSGRVDIIRARDGQPERRSQTSGPIRSVALSPDEALIACGLAKGNIALIRLDSEAAATEMAGHQDSVESVDFSPDGRTLVTASKDRTVALWRVDGLSAKELLRIPSPSGRSILAARFTPDGRNLGILVQNEHAVRIWHLDTLRARLGDLGLDWNDGGSSPAVERR